MKILVYGAGAIGSLYGARLAASGHEVHLLARGERLRQLAKHGVILEDGLTGQRSVVKVPVVIGLNPGDAYDLVLVAVRKTQVEGVLPALAANVASRDILFFMNTAEGYDAWVRAVGRERLLAGFPGAGGVRDGPVIRHALEPAWFERTVLGELDGRITPRLLGVAAAFRGAGFPVALSRNVDAWQKTHVAWASPATNALYLALDDAERLVHSQEALELMVDAIRENLGVLRALGVPVTPRTVALWRWLPRRLLAAIWARVLRGRVAQVNIVSHAVAARAEMRELAAEMRALARRAERATPACDRLWACI